jgi:GDP-L-fucose synthase
MRKIIEARESNAPFVEMWGSGSPRREFLHADDLADACVFLMENYNEPEFVNIGTGEDLTIKDLALLIKKIVGYEGEIKHDTSKPDGTPRKLMDVSKLNALGWKATIPLEEGIRMVYEDIKDRSWVEA